MGQNIVSQAWKSLNVQWYYFKRKCRVTAAHYRYQHSAFKASNEALLQSLKGKYAGKRIFIVCNGPSLRAEDLEKIHQNGDFSFGCNFIQYIYPKTQWRPNFFTMLDIGPQRDRIDVMRNCPAEIQFYRRDAYSTLCKTRRDNFCVVNTLDKPELLEHPKFSDDCSKILYFIGTTTYGMLQLAVHMGFKELYIIGCDNNYAVNVKKDGTRVNTGAKAYFDGMKGSSVSQSVGFIWQFDIAYQAAQEFASKHGIKIYNATRGGHLEAFPRVDFDSLFQ